MHFEWLALAAFLLALLADHFISWPAFLRFAALDAAKARRAWWSRTAAMLWGCTALVLALWEWQGVPLSTLGLAAPQGWRLWLALFVVVAIVWVQVAGALRSARMAADKSKLRAQLGSTGLVMPHAASELPAWVGISVTAGFCEELLFRGCVIALLQPVAGWWIAAAVSLAVFAAAHAYQGATGVVRSAAMGALLTAFVFVSQSLWPAIVLHAALDVMGGCIGWLIVRDAAPPPLAATV